MIGDTNTVGSTNPGISVTSGSEGYSTGTDGYGTGGLDGTFNGSILDYGFYTTGTGSLVESYGGAASLINTPTIPGSGTSSDAAGISIWAGSSTGGAADQTTWSRPVDVSGTVNIAGLTSGSLYMFFGTRVGTGELTDISFTLSGGAGGPVTLSETGINQASQGGTVNNTWFVYRADFADVGDYTTLTYTYDNASSNTAARSRFGGVVLTAVPEPSPFMLLGVAGVMLLVLRRRRCD